MDNFIKEGEQMLEGNNNNNQSNNNNNENNNNNNNQSSNEGNNQQQSTGNSGGGFMSGMKQNTEDAYVNNEVNSFLTKEGLPSSMDGAVDGAIDTEFNKYA